MTSHPDKRTYDLPMSRRVQALRSWGLALLAVALLLTAGRLFT